MAKRIVIRVSPDGTTTELEVDGIKGTSCKIIIGKIMKFLKLKGKGKNKPDYYDKPDKQSHRTG